MSGCVFNDPPHKLRPVGNTLFFKWAECVLIEICEAGFIEDFSAFTAPKLVLFHNCETARKKSCKIV